MYGCRYDDIKFLLAILAVVAYPGFCCGSWRWLSLPPWCQHNIAVLQEKKRVRVSEALMPVLRYFFNRSTCLENPVHQNHVPGLKAYPRVEILTSKPSTGSHLVYLLWAVASVRCRLEPVLLQTTKQRTGGIIFPVVFKQLEPRVGLAWATRSMALIQLATLVFPVIWMRSRTPTKIFVRLIDWNTIFAKEYMPSCC